MCDVQLTQANQDHVYAVEKVADGHFQSVFPEPLSEMSHGHSTEKAAYGYLLQTKMSTPGGENWGFDDPTQAAKMVCEYLLTIPGAANLGVIESDWMFHKSGTPVSEIWTTLQQELWQSDGERGEFAATNDQLRIAKDLWKDLRDTPIDHDGHLLEDWMFFKAGTQRHVVWHWLEESLNVSVARDLMGIV